MMMFSPKPKPFWQWAAVLSLLSAPILLVSWPSLYRPAQQAQAKKLFQGMTYQQTFRSNPRPMMVHIITLDLKEAGLKPFATPSTPSIKPAHTSARLTSTFVQEFGLQLAVNANFFYPFHENTPWDYYPHQSDRTSVIGSAISNGRAYAKNDNKYPAICFSALPMAKIVAEGGCPAGTTQAVAGNEIFLTQNKPDHHASERSRNTDEPYPRTAIGIDGSGKKVWLIVIDGKQPLYSEGATMKDLTEIADNLGIETALNLDGGGSTTLAIATPNGPKVLNSPIRAKIPTWERPVANHLGFYARPTSVLSTIRTSPKVNYQTSDPVTKRRL
jgi:Phosphodiester glycosidase